MMDNVRQAMTESVGHSIFTVELALGVLFGLTFVALYFKTDWWRNRGGRLSMGNMTAWTVVAAGGLLYRLSWQTSALTLLIPACVLVLIVQAWWITQLVLSWRCTPNQRAKALADALEVLAWQLADEGRTEAAEATFKQSRALAELLPPPAK